MSVGGRRAAWVLAGMLCGLLAGCGGKQGIDGEISNFRYDPVSPCGEILGVPTASEVQYKALLLEWFHQVDANHDGVVTQGEVEARCDAFFTRLDSDKDGTITPLELEDYRLHQPFHPPERRATPRLGDNLRVVNPDMVPPVGQDDDDSWFSGPSTDSTQIRQGLDPVMSADADADFRVTRDELRAQTDRKFARWDLRHDGRVTAQEFIDALLGPLHARTQS